MPVQKITMKQALFQSQQKPWMHGFDILQEFFCEMNIYALEGHNRGMGIRTIAYRYDDVMCVHSLVLYAGLRARVQVFELASYRFRCEQLQF